MRITDEAHHEPRTGRAGHPVNEEPGDGRYAELERRVRQVLDQLPLRERSVVELRFGLKDGRAYTRRLTAEILGIPVEHVATVERRAIERLRRRER